MPRKKKKKIDRSSKISAKKFRFAWAENWMQSYSSFLLGIVAVIVLCLFVVSVIRQQHKIQQTSSLSTGPVQSATTQPSPTPGATIVENGNTYYVVKPNDSLWTIAEKIYNDGYQWTKIATANNLANPSIIFTGDKLLLPDAPKPSELGQVMQKENPQTNAITGNSYVVVKGDSLWDVAVRAYADGY